METIEEINEKIFELQKKKQELARIEDAKFRNSITAIKAKAFDDIRNCLKDEDEYYGTLPKVLNELKDSLNIIYNIISKVEKIEIEGDE